MGFAGSYSAYKSNRDLLFILGFRSRGGVVGTTLTTLDFIYLTNLKSSLGGRFAIFTISADSEFHQGTFALSQRVKISSVPDFYNSRNQCFQGGLFSLGIFRCLLK